MELLHTPLFLLLLIILLGEALGRLRIGSFSFGSSGIIFVALLFGHLGYTLPEEFQTLGLVLFIYSVGLQAGPGFVSSFKSHGLALTLGALTMIGTGAAAALVCSLAFGYGAGTGTGLFAGALTSTPGLAAAVEATGSAAAPAAYGVTYAFGVVGVIVFIRLLPRLLRVDLKKEEAEMDREMAESHPPVTFGHYEVTNPNLFNRRLSDIYLKNIAPVTITRLLRRGASEPVLAFGDTVLQEGDRLRIVGREEDLKKVELYIGRPIVEGIAFNRVLARKSIVVSKPDFAGQTLGTLNVAENFNVQVGRITRNGIDLPATAHLRLHLGDVLHAVGDERSLRNVTRLLGNDLKATYDVNILAIFVGLFLGFLLGKVPFHFPVAGKVTLGTTGGVLLSGLFLGRLYKTGPFIWEVPASTNSFLREMGLAFFLAAVGTSAGAVILDTLARQGLSLLLAGVVVTLSPLLAVLLLCRLALRLRFLRMLGVMAGGMTSTPGLAVAASLSAAPYAAAAYATVYPVALIAKILAIKLLAAALG